MKKGTRLLISYHSNDGRWKDVFDRHCEPYRENGELEVVYDEISSRGVHFNQPIDENIPLFDVVFLIISKDYLALDMVSNGNIEQLLTTFDNHNVKIVLVHAEHCEWQKHEWIIKRGLWPNNSNALADDWGYEERLNRLVSELIKDLIAEKRDIDLTINQQKGRFGDNRDKNHLREKFMAFLLKEKGCLNPSLHMDNSDIIVGVGKRCGLEIIGEGETLAVIEFGMSENDSVISSASKIFQPYMNYKTSAKIKFYLVLPYVSGLGEEFDIHEFDMITHEEVGIFCKDFPKYEDLIWKVTGKVVKGGNVENKNFQTIFDEAQDAFNKSDFDRAIQLFDDAIKLNQYDTASWVLLARALSKVGKQDQAFTCFDTALQFAKNKSYVLLYKGTVYRDIGNRVAEFDCYDRAIENDPTYIQTYMQKAHVLQQEGNHEGAIECFKKGPENDLKPDREALLWHSLAAAYIPIGRLEEAYKSINRSLDLNDNEFTRRIKRLIIDEMSQKGLIDDGDIKIEVPDV
ncbi:MAG: tetratricopeptide repeat protein, partial [Anaerohalosphaera sp.]|nr:tetratricopeptide repeat protein [Anaerohalosphaera sp.]